MLNQKELANKIRNHTGFKYNIKDVEIILSAFTSVVVEAVSSGEDVYMKELGKFYPKFVKGKTITNAGIPWLNGKQYKIENRFKLGFSPNKAASKKIEALLSTLKEYAVNNDKKNTNSVTAS